MKIGKNWLSAEELSVIVGDMLEKTNSVEREIVKVGIVAQLVVEDLGEFESCNEIYNKVMEENVDFEKEIFNYYVIDKLFAEETSTAKVVKDFFADFEGKIDKYTSEIKDTDTEGLISQLKEIANKKEV